MGSTVDDRIVRMGFDNKEFERGIKQSSDSLDGLKKSLNLDGASKGLDGLDRAMRAFNFDTMANGIDELNNKFSALGVIGLTALQNLTNSAVNAGKTMVSALTIDPIKSGFSEYETKMGSIQTILTNTASKGTKLEDVTAALDDLNKYADQTIYNFAEMTKNIGTFTAAGVDLDTSKVAIKGIANLAAASGSNAQQASTAMYQLSQALAAGSVKLMDWNSVVNAGMGGELFKNALQDTAREMGTDVDSLIKKNGSFRESLQEGWITADILNTTLKKMTKEGAKDYGDAMLKTGKYTQAQVDALMDQATMAENAATEVKTLTQMYSTMKESVQSGWAQSWESIIGDKDESTKVLTAINAAFGDLVGPSAKARNEILAFWNEFGGRDAIIKGLSNVFKGLSSIMKPIGQAFKKVFPPITGTRLIELSQKFEELTAKFKIGKETIKDIYITFKGFFSIIHIGVQLVTGLVKAIASVVGVVFPASKGILGITSSLGGLAISLDKAITKADVFGTIAEGIKKKLEGLPSILDGFKFIGKIFSGMAKAVSEAFKTISGSIGTGLDSIDPSKVFGVLNGAILTGILLGFKNLMGKLPKLFSSGAGAIDKIKGIFNGLLDTLKMYQTELQAGILMKIAISVGILAASLFLLSTIEPAKMAAALAAMSALFGGLIVSLNMFSKVVAGPGFKKMATLTVLMLALSVSMLMLSASVAILGHMKWDELAKGLLGISVLLGVLVIFMKKLDAGKVGVKSGATLMIIAAALLVMATAVRIIGTMDMKDLAKGLFGITYLLGILLGFMKLVGDPKEGLIPTAIGLTIMASALVIFAGALALMGSMSMLTLAKGIGALAVSLVIMTVAMKFMKDGLPGAAAMLVMAAAIAVLAPALFILGSMSLKKIGKSLLALVGVFVVMGVAALTLAPLVPVIMALAGAIALIGLACLAVGAGLVLFSTGMAALAVSGVAGAVALVAIATSLAGLIPMFFIKVGEGLLELARVLGEGAPTVITAIVKLINAILDGILLVVPQIVEKGVEIVLAFIYGINSAIPKLLQAGFDLVIGFINGLANAIRNNTDPLIDAMGNLMDAVIDAAKKALETAVPNFLSLGKDVVNGFVNGIKEGFPSVGKWATNLGTSALAAAKKALDSNSPSKKFMDLGKFSADGFAIGLNKYAGNATSASESMGTSALEALRNSMSNLSGVLTGDMNLTPTIRPVLDASGITSGMSAAFGKQQTLNVGAVKTRVAGAYSERVVPTNQNGSVAPTNPIYITVTGNTIANDYDMTKITDNLSAQIARELRRNK